MRKTITLIVSLTLLASLQAKVYYVTPEATNKASKSGTYSWDNPVSLASAIDSATTTSDEVWIKGGFYPMHRAVSTRKAGIVIATGLKKIYGGFVGTETAVSQRLRSDLDGNGTVEPWEFTNLTIFDGATMEDYTVTYTSKQEVYSTLSTKPTVAGTFLSPSKKAVMSLEGGSGHIVDGIVVQNGKFDGDGYASGMNVACNATVRNCIVRNCNTTRIEDIGGGHSLSNAAALRIYGASANVSSCLIEDNSAGPLLPGAYCSGAGVCLADGTLSNSIIRNNVAYVRSALVATDLSITGFAAGEIAALGITAPTVTQNGNARSAGVYMYGGNSASRKAPLLSGCIVANNECVSYDAVVTNTSTLATSAIIYGVGILVDNSGVVMNCVSVNNKVSFALLNTSGLLPTPSIEGIGVYLRSGNPYTITTPVLTRNTIVGCYNTIALGNQSPGAVSATKTDISMKGNTAYAADYTSVTLPIVAGTTNTTTTTTATLSPFSTREVKNCMVGGTGIFCDVPSTGTIVCNDNIASASTSVITFSPAQKTALQTVPTGCVFSQNVTNVFSKPNAIVGRSTDASIKTANWKLKDATYAASGLAVNLQWSNYSSTNSPTVYTYTAPVSDLMGNAYGSSPAIGAILSSSGVLSSLNSPLFKNNNVQITKNFITTNDVVSSIEVYNLSGKLVAQDKNTKVLSISHLSPNVYIAVVDGEKVKFVK